MGVANEWTRIDSWLHRNAPPVSASLTEPLPPGGEADESLPAELLQSFQVHDGQRGEVAFFEGFSLMSLTECLAVRRFMGELRRDFDEAYEAIGATYWRETWFPFLDDRSGSLVCADAESGGVIAFFHDQPDRPVVAKSLEALLDEIATAMESGDCVVEDIGVRLVDEQHPLARRLWG